MPPAHLPPLTLRRVLLHMAVSLLVGLVATPLGYTFGFFMAFLAEEVVKLDRYAFLPFPFYWDRFFYTCGVGLTVTVASMVILLRWPGFPRRKAWLILLLLVAVTILGLPFIAAVFRTEEPVMVLWPIALILCSLAALLHLPILPFAPRMVARPLARCFECNYDLRGSLESESCPECGHPISETTRQEILRRLHLLQ